MTKQDMLVKIAEHYTNDGYAVQSEGVSGLLPDTLKDQEIDLVATRGTEHIAVQVKRRDELYELSPSAGTPVMPPGWRIELVVYPSPSAEFDFPLNGVQQSPEHTQALIDEAEKLITAGSVRAGFVLAWAATEAAMREATNREGIELTNPLPRNVLRSLHSSGVISREDFDRASGFIALRNEVAHGFPTHDISEEAPRFLLDLARRLHCEGTAQCKA